MIKLLDYTYPKIFELSGGKATMLEIIQGIDAGIGISGLYS
jgi:hypothetical protein